MSPNRPIPFARARLLRPDTPPIDLRDEQQLVARIRRGDEQAFRYLFETYYGGLCAFASAQLHSRTAAQDLVNDLFARLWERRDTWELRTNLRTYLFSAVRHRTSNARRDEKTLEHWKTQMAAQDIPVGMSQGAQPADSHVQQIELATALDRSILTLPERQQTVLLLRLRHHLTNAEVATVVGISEKAVEKVLNRAFKTLRQMLAGFA